MNTKELGACTTLPCPKCGRNALYVDTVPMVMWDQDYISGKKIGKAQVLWCALFL